MKRKSVFLFLIILILSTLTFSTAFASTSLDANLFTPKKEEFIKLNSPYLTATSNDYAVYFDTDGIKVSGSTSGQIPLTVHFSSSAIYQDVIYALSDDYSIHAYDLTNFSEIATHPFTSIQARHIAIENSTIYLNDGNEILSCDLSQDTPTLTSFTPYLESSKFELNDGNLVYSKSSARKSYLVSGNTEKEIPEQFFDLAVEDYVFTLSHDKKQIKAYDKTTLDIVFSLNLDNAVSDILVNDSKVYLADSTNNCVYLYTVNSNGFTYLSTICNQGSALGKFNSPTALFAHGSNVIVADKLNNRIQVFGDNGSISSAQNTISWDTSLTPDDVVEHNGKYYILANNKVYALSGLQTVIYDNGFVNPSDLAVDCFATVYLTTDSGIYAKSEGAIAFTKFLDINAIDITVSPKGSVLYALTLDNKITAYDSLGSLIFTTETDKTFSANARIDTDVSGNMFILDGSSLYKYARSVSGYSLEYEKQITFNNQTAICSDLSLSLGGTIYLTSSVNNCVYSLTNEQVLSSVYNPNSFTPPINAYDKVALTTPAKYVKVKQTNSFAYDFAQSFENARIVPANTTLLLLDNQTVNGFYYVYYSGKDCYIHSSAVDPLTSSAFNQYDGFALHSCRVYKYPVIDQTKSFSLLEMQNGTAFKVVGNSNNYTSLNANGTLTYWNEILFDNKIYYIERTNIAVANVEREVDYGYAKLHSDTVGKKINLYMLPDEASAIIGEFVDGTEVKLLTAIDNASTFTEVKIGDQIGYVKTSQLTTNGLTTAQIVILVLVLIGGASSVSILIINRKMHRSR